MAKDTQLVVTKILDRQLKAMGGDIFEFGISNEETRVMTLRTWSKAKALDCVRWLRYKSFRRHHIYVRPYGSAGLLLVDDICLGDLARMEADGIVPACVIETSPMNHQVWVRVSGQPIPPNLGTAVGEVLQTRYSGDPNSKDWRHFGRAAGFTNVKPKHVMENGFYPFSKLIAAEGGITPNADALLQDAEQLLQRKEVEEKRSSRPTVTRTRNPPAIPAETAYRSAIQHVYGQYGNGTNWNQADFAAAKHMYYQGYAREDIEEAMRNDVNIAKRKRGHVEDYIRRTLDAMIKKC